MKRLRLATVTVLIALSTADIASVLAQSPPSQTELKRQVERRFDVLPLRSGVALRPKDAGRGFRSIELSDGTIAIDGVPATGAELRSRLGQDADMVLRLSYLDDQTRSQVFGSAAAGPPAPLVPPAPPAEPAPPELATPPSAPERPRRSREGGDQVRFGGSVIVEEGELVSGDAVAIGGSVTVDGEVSGNAVAVGGSLALGPHAYVHGDAVAIGGGLSRDAGARVGGKVVNIGAGFPFRGGQFSRFPFGHRFGFPPMFGAAAGGLFAFMATLARLAVLCVLACAVLLVGRDHVERASAQAAAEPVKAGAIGLLAQLLFVPVLVITILLLIVTIVGIPLLVLIPFALLALAIVGLIGFTGVAYNLGELVNRRMSWSGENPYITAIRGIVLLLSPILIARLVGIGAWLLFPITGTLVFLGFLVEYLAWTVGFGAVALQRFTKPGSPISQPPAVTPQPAV